MCHPMSEHTRFITYFMTVKESQNGIARRCIHDNISDNPIWQVWTLK